jgi:hypothetical protein
MKSEYSWLYAWYGVGYTSCNEHVRFKYLATWDLGPDSLIWRCTARQLLLVQHKLCWSTKGRSCVHYVVSVDDDLVCQDYWTNISYDYIYIYIYMVLDLTSLEYQCGWHNQMMMMMHIYIVSMAMDLHDSRVFCSI